MARGTSKFDQMFSSLINEKAAQTPTQETRTPRKNSSDAGVENQIQKAVVLFHGARYAHCLNEIRKVEDVAADDPRVAALLGACNALVSGRLKPGIERCTELIEQTFYIPELYAALGVLLVKSHRRAQAYTVFERGLKIDPHHKALRNHVREMGQRRKPVVRFLDRTHPVNYALGVLRSRLAPA